MKVRNRSARRRGVARRSTTQYIPRALLAAAIALPGLAIIDAHAAAPEEGLIGFKYLYYRDYQPGGERMRVTAPSAFVAKTLPGDVVVNASGVLDSVSGASPLYHSTLSGASGKGIHDYRKAADLKVTKYWDRVSVGVGGAFSTEHDYQSKAGSLDLRIASADNNTTWALGVANARDSIDSTNLVAVGKHRNTNDFLAGVTQVLTPRDVVQTNLTVSRGTGYYNDPYKAIDVRPDYRNQYAWLVRWNHYVESMDASVRLTSRLYRDSFGVKSVTLAAEWVQPIGNRWTVVPSLRYYSQSAADFYFDPPYPTGYTGSGFYSADQRLSAFGAFTPGIKLIKEFASGWAVDFKAEYYEQRGDWRLQGKGSPGLLPLKAQIYQVGISTKF